MIKSFVEKIQKLVEDRMLVEVDGLKYTAATLAPVLFEPIPSAVRLSTLDSFCDFIKKDLDKSISQETHIVVVDSYKSVSLLSNLKGLRRQREALVTATLPDIETFNFGDFMSQEEFCIHARSLFQKTEGDDLEYLLSFVSKIIETSELSVNDDGVSQNITVAKGTTGALVEVQKSKPIVKLAPYRTFREIEQPLSEFLLRVKTDKTTQAGLFEADGGAWVLEAVARIKSYIEQRVELTVIA